MTSYENHNNLLFKYLHLYDFISSEIVQSSGRGKRKPFIFLRLIFSTIIHDIELFL